MLCLNLFKRLRDPDDSQENWITPHEISYMWPEALMPPWPIMKQFLRKTGVAAHHKSQQDTRALWRGVAKLADVRKVRVLH